MNYRKFIVSLLAAVSLFGIATVSNAHSVAFFNYSKHDLLLFRNANFPTVFLNAKSSVFFDDSHFAEMCKDETNSCAFRISRDGSDDAASATVTFTGTNVTDVENSINNIFIAGMHSRVVIK